MQIKSVEEVVPRNASPRCMQAMHKVHARQADKAASFRQTNIRRAGWPMLCGPSRPEVE